MHGINYIPLRATPQRVRTGSSKILNSSRTINIKIDLLE
jgi:hypothetical protein